MIYGLTDQQRKLLNFIRQRESESKNPPSYDEMGEALGLESKSGIHRLIRGLEERGYIRRLPYRARTIRVTALGDGRLPGPDEISEHITDLRPEIEEMLKEAQRHALLIYGTEADFPLIMGVWLWHAIRGSSPGFLQKEA